MKRFLGGILMAVLLAGCSRSDGAMDRAVSMRQELLDADGCTFTVSVTADYGDKIHTFEMDCAADREGDLTFTVTAPGSIAGITGTVTDEKGSLTFDGKALAFELLADGQVTPVSAPWILIHTLRGGYLTACAEESDGFRLSIDDSYEDDALHLDIWVDQEMIPAEAEILWKNRRILSMTIENFQYL